MTNKNLKLLFIILLSPVYFFIAKSTTTQDDFMVDSFEDKTNAETTQHSSKDFNKIHSLPVGIEFPIQEDMEVESTTTVEIETEIEMIVEETTQEVVETECVEALNEYKYYLSDGEKNLLARLVMAESEGEPLDGKIAVAQVVLYRSLKYGCSVYEVINAQGQFSSVGTLRMDLVPNEECYLAVECVLKGEWVLSSDIEFFYNPHTSNSTWFDSLTYRGTIGNHNFYSN